MTEDQSPAAGSKAEDATDHAQGPLGDLPKLTRRQIELERRLGIAGPQLAQEMVDGWNHLLGGGMVADRFAVQWRAAGLRRPGVVAHLIWPRLRSRVALGIDPPLAHAVVDRLLGFERAAAESRLQISPVEWGVLSFVIARGLERLDDQPGPLGPWDLAIDRVGPDPFDVAGLGAVVTWRWQVQVGPTTGAARLWIPESLLTGWLATAEDAAGRSQRVAGRESRPACRRSRQVRRGVQHVACRDRNHYRRRRRGQSSPDARSIVPDRRFSPHWNGRQPGRGRPAGSD